MGVVQPIGVLPASASTHHASARYLQLARIHLLSHAPPCIPERRNPSGPRRGPWLSVRRSARLAGVSNHYAEPLGSSRRQRRRFSARVINSILVSPDGCPVSLSTATKGAEIAWMRHHCPSGKSDPLDSPKTFTRFPMLSGWAPPHSSAITPDLRRGCEWMETTLRGKRPRRLMTGADGRSSSNMAITFAASRRLGDGGGACSAEVSRGGKTMNGKPLGGVIAVV